MQFHRLALLCLSFPILLQACATTSDRQDAPEPTGIIIQGVVIRNELPFQVTDVMFLVPATGNFAGCGTLLAHSECSISIEAVDYYANPVMISWKEYGQPQQTDEFVIRVPEDLEQGRPARLEAIIFARGQAGAKLSQ